MALDTLGIRDAVVSHALASGLFDRVNTYEPDNLPGTGLTAAVNVVSWGPARAASGLCATSGRVEFSVKLYFGMLSDPPDDIDAGLLAAGDALFAAYSGDFTLGGLIRNVDLAGASGAPLHGELGYIDLQGALYRVAAITLPVVVNDVWAQAP